MINNFTTTPVAVLDHIGNIRNGRTSFTPEQVAKALCVPADYLALVLGLIDGDGTIRVLRQKKDSIQMQLIISLHLDDLPMLESIQQTLGFGKIYIYPHSAKLVFTLGQLQMILFPLMKLHGLQFFTTQRLEQFDRLMYVLNTGITKFSDIPAVVPVTHPLLSASEILATPHFANWFVGFTIAEGSFFSAADGRVGFTINQKTSPGHVILFDAIKQLLNTNANVLVNEGKYLKLTMRNALDIELVIRFFSFSGHLPLMGLKLASYQNWLRIVSTKPKLAGIKLPEDV